MSRRKRKQAEIEARRQAELSATQQPKVVRKLKVSYEVMNNSDPVPVARPADHIQLTPIVQPLPLVPYSTQKQPFFQFDEDGEY